MKAKLVRTQDVAPRIKTFWFKPESPLDYVAGQYLELVLPHENPDNRGERRWFSLSSSPTEPLLGLTIKFETADGSTFKKTLLSLQPGGEVMLTDPLGDFVLPKNLAIPLVFVAAGIGITPVRGMVQWLTDKHQQRDLQLVYITRSPADMAFLPLFESYDGLQLDAIHTRSRKKGERLAAQDILALIGDPQDKLIYLSGPERLIEGLWTDLQKHGVGRRQLVLDYFPGYDAL
jgi:ferredoxin-NADP reductase